MDAKENGVVWCSEKIMWRNYARGMVIVLKLVFDVFTKVEFRITNFYFYLR